MLGLSNIYKIRPSTLLDIVDPYTSYCFDQACAYIVSEMENGKEPIFTKKYKSFSELYRQYK